MFTKRHMQCSTSPTLPLMSLEKAPYCTSVGNFVYMVNFLAVSTSFPTFASSVCNTHDLAITRKYTLKLLPDTLYIICAFTLKVMHLLSDFGLQVNSHKARPIIRAV